MPHRNVRGFTLIELMMVVTIIGILASITAHQVEVKKAVWIATMRSDLRNLSMMQESYFDDHKKYASNVNQLDWNTTQYVYEVIVGQHNGWTARVSHRILTDHQCAIFVGDVTPHFSPATDEGVIACTMGTSGSGGGSGGSGGSGGGGGGKKP